MTIREAGKKLREGSVSCVELVKEAVDRINPDFNAFLTVTSDEALREAKVLDDELAAGNDRGPLHGIPIGLKDLFHTAGVRTTNGSALFRDFLPSSDAMVVTKLREAGAISIGKLNQHELAYGITSNNPHFGTIRNPHDRERIPGGSSGGSGVAVADGTIFCGMGSDTGGSIRVPASYCGTVGLKPTFGRVSRSGCFALGLTLDHMGPLTRTVDDAALVMRAIEGYDPADETTTRRAWLEPKPLEDLKGVRIGWPTNFYFERVETEVQKSVEAVRKHCETLGAEIVDLAVPDPAALNTIARTVLFAEAASMLAPYVHRRSEIGADVLASLDQGSLITAVEYVNAQRVRRRMQREWRALFEKVDVLLTPTTPIVAPRIGAATVLVGGQEEDARLASTRFVRGINALGFPALSLPCGTAGGLPVGLQIVGAPWQEQVILEVGDLLEKAAGKQYTRQER